MSLRVLLTVTLLLLGRFLSAQCPTSVTATTTESRCKENGTITVTALPAAAYTYEIVAGPSLSDPTSSSIFTSLSAGTYTIEVSRGGCVYNVTATVAGNYVDPGLISVSSVGKIACPSGTTCATAAQPTNGRLPWKYSIIAGPVLKPSQSNPTFCGLTEGSYSIQAQDSCGVVRTTQFTVGLDTGYLWFEQAGWAVSLANCTDIIVNPISDWYNTNSHSLVKIWWVKPNGDTIKTKGFRPAPIGADTLVNEANTYGTWKGVAWDTCGRKWETVFDRYPPGLSVSSAAPTCTGYQVEFGNQWKYGVTVGYTIRKCSDNSIVHNLIQVPPATTFYSPSFDLEWDTCYYIEHYNECGDTVRLNNYSRTNDNPFRINGCGGPGCKTRGNGDISVWPNWASGTGNITYTILSGPYGVGTSQVSTGFRDMPLGTYVIKGEDECGKKDTITVVSNKPLIKSIDVTQKLNCSGGADLHIKITSNYISCATPYSGTYFTTGLNNTAPNLGSPLNVTTTGVTQTTSGTWEGDFTNVMYDSVRIYYYAYDGCQDDTLIKIIQYKPPVITNAVGYVCNSSGIGVLNYILLDGKAPFRFRIKQDISNTWSAWQDSAVFSGISAGAYDIEVQDACPNSQIRSATFYSWEKSDFDMAAPCAEYGDPFTLTVNPRVNYVSYRWYKDNVLVGSGPSYTIPSFSSSDQGRYTLRQVFKNGGCVDSTSKWVVHCSILNLLFGELSGSYKDNNVHLKWNTLRDAPGTDFIIERSFNAVTYTKIGTIAGLQNSNGSDYRFTDNNTLISAYYRIKYISANGKKGYSNVFRIGKNDIIDIPVTVRPIPFNSWFVVETKNIIESPCLIVLYDITGKTVYKKNEKARKGKNAFWLDDDSITNLPRGAYILEVSTDEFNKKIKIVKQ